MVRPSAKAAKRGRPRRPDALLKPRMIRLSASIDRRLEIARRTRTDGADVAHIIRELLDKHLPPE